jgi:hypothetical protein
MAARSMLAMSFLVQRGFVRVKRCYVVEAFWPYVTDAAVTLGRLNTPKVTAATLDAV